MSTSQNPFGLPFTSFSPDAFAKFVPTMMDPFNAMTRDAFNANDDRTKASLKSMQDMGTSMMAGWKKHVALSMETGKKLSSADSIEDAMAIQAGYLKSCYEANIKSASEMTKLYTDTMRTAFAPITGKD